MSHTPDQDVTECREALDRARESDRRALRALKRRTEQAALVIPEMPRVDGRGGTDGGVLYHWPGFPARK